MKTSIGLALGPPTVIKSASQSADSGLVTLPPCKSCSLCFPFMRYPLCKPLLPVVLMLNPELGRPLSASSAGAAPGSPPGSQSGRLTRGSHFCVKAWGPMAQVGRKPTWKPNRDFSHNLKWGDDPNGLCSGMKQSKGPSKDDVLNPWEVLRRPPCQLRGPCKNIALRHLFCFLYFSFPFFFWGGGECCVFSLFIFEGEEDSAARCPK